MELGGAKIRVNTRGEHSLSFLDRLGVFRADESQFGQVWMEEGSRFGICFTFVCGIRS
jgi:hypothetical protein